MTERICTSNNTYHDLKHKVLFTEKNSKADRHLYMPHCSTGYIMV